MLKLSHSKPFHNTLNYASTANIQEVIKSYNLGDKTFETDFRKDILSVKIPRDWQHVTCRRIWKMTCLLVNTFTGLAAGTKKDLVMLEI